MPSTPYVVAATYLAGHELKVEFSDGVVKAIDSRPDGGVVESSDSLRAGSWR